jgi:hypothetical protein
VARVPLEQVNCGFRRVARKLAGPDRLRSLLDREQESCADSMALTLWIHRKLLKARDPRSGEVPTREGRLRRIPGNRTDHDPVVLYDQAFTFSDSLCRNCGGLVHGCVRQAQIAKLPIGTMEEIGKLLQRVRGGELSDLHARPILLMSVLGIIRAGRRRHTRRHSQILLLPRPSADRTLTCSSLLCHQRLDP